MHPKVKQAQERIFALETERKSADTAFETARKSFLEGDADPSDPTTPEFKALDEAGKSRDQVVEQLAGARQAFATVAAATGTQLGGGNDDGDGQGRKSSDDPEREAALRRETLGKRLIDGDEYKALRERGVFTSSAQFGAVELSKELATREETKALVGIGAASGGVENLVYPQHDPLIVMKTRPIVISQLISKGIIDTTSVDYPVETAVAQDAAFVKDPTTAGPISSSSPVVTAVQAGLKPETSLSFDKRTANVKTLAVFLPAFRNTLEDVAYLQSHIDTRLRGQLDQKIEDQVTTGDGTGENFTGILATSGIGSHTQSGETFIDAIHKGITTVRLAFEEPSAVGLHPLDWELIRLAKDSVAGYYFGPPSQAGQSTLWGLPVVVSTAIPQGTAIVGDWSLAMLWLRSGTRVLASDSHADFFRRNLVAILAELRAAFGVLKPQGFCKVVAA